MKMLLLAAVFILKEGEAQPLDNGKPGRSSRYFKQK